MRKSWRTAALLLLAMVWPQFGCLQLPADKALQETRTLPEKLPAAPAPKGTQASMLNPPPQNVSADTVPQWLSHADALEKAHKLNEAAAAYEQIRQAGGPQVGLATQKLALLYYRNNDMDHAEQEFRLLLQQNRKDADVLCYLGDIYYRRALWGTAWRCFKEASDYNPKHELARTGLGMTLAQQGEYAPSVEEFTRIMSESEAYRKVAGVMKTQGKWNDAIVALQTALGKDPANAQARAELMAMRQAGPPPGPLPGVQPGAPNGTTVVRVTRPPNHEQHALVELEADLSKLAHEPDTSLSRLMSQRRALPPLPDLDLTSGAVSEWETHQKGKH